LARTLELAEDLNANIEPLQDEDEARALSRYVASEGVEHVVLPFEKSGGLKRLLRKSLGEELLSANPGLELHILSNRR